MYCVCVCVYYRYRNIFGKSKQLAINTIVENHIGFHSSGMLSRILPFYTSLLKNWISMIQSQLAFALYYLFDINSYFFPFGNFSNAYGYQNIYLKSSNFNQSYQFRCFIFSLYLAHTHAPLPTSICIRYFKNPLRRYLFSI